MAFLGILLDDRLNPRFVEYTYMCMSRSILALRNAG
jgi:hypothetical protein